jgi:hypothetical protein
MYTYPSNIDPLGDVCIRPGGTPLALEKYEGQQRMVEAQEHIEARVYEQRQRDGHHGPIDISGLLPLVLAPQKRLHAEPEGDDVESPQDGLAERAGEFCLRDREAGRHCEEEQSFALVESGDRLCSG